MTRYFLRDQWGEALDVFDEPDEATAAMNARRDTHTDPTAPTLHLRVTNDTGAEIASVVHPP